MAVSLHQHSVTSSDLAFDLSLDASGGGAALHTNFSIAADGEPVLLSTPDGTIVDELRPVAIPRDMSLGRVGADDSSWFYFTMPTPGTANETEAFAELLEPVQFSHLGGFYTDPFLLNLTHVDPDVDIIYTLDGSTPDVNNLGGTTYSYKAQYRRLPSDTSGPLLQNSYRSHPFTEPLTIADRSPDPDKLAPIASAWGWHPFYENSVSAMPSGPVRKGTVVRAKAVKAGALSPRPSTHTYFVLPEGNPYDLPVISLSIQENLLFDYEDGVYTAGKDFDDWRNANPTTPWSWVRPHNFNRRGGEWEYPAHMELFMDGVPSAVINQGVGFRIHGGAARARLPQKSLRLYARYLYDSKNVFQQRLFDDSVPFAVDPDTDQFKRILLRGAGNTAYYINDVITHQVMQPVYEGVQRVRPALKFINGENFGITAIRDRIDQHHYATHYNLDPDNIIMLDGVFGEGTLEHIDVGEAEDLELYREFYDFVLAADMADPENFSILKSMLDIQSYVDFNITKIYFSDRDWRGDKHFGLWRVREPSDDHFGDGRWRAYVWDFDWAGELEHRNRNLLETATHPDGGGWLGFSPSSKTALLRNLLESDTFKHFFINRFADHLNTTFLPSRVEALMKAELGRLAPYLPENEDRWGWNIVPQNRTDGYLAFARLRPTVQRQHIRSYFRIRNNIAITLDVSDLEQGHVRINTIEIKEGTPGLTAQPYPWPGLYFEGIPIELEAFPKEGFRFAGWLLNGSDEIYSSDRILSVDLKQDIALEAKFEPSQPPIVNPLELPEIITMVAGRESLRFSMRPWFEHPLGLDLAFKAESSDDQVVRVGNYGSTLILSGRGSGEAQLTVVAIDGFAQEAVASIRVLVYPESLPLAQESYFFAHWSADEPAGSYPDYMIFLQGSSNDSAINQVLDRAYEIPAEDAANEDDAAYPYRSSSRTRINGLGDDGIAFINTGRGRDLGGALLALDTRSVFNATVSWSAGTLLANTRVYAIRLQYRIGHSGTFSDVLDDEGHPVEYMRNTQDGHQQSMGVANLPPAALGREYVQLLWRYYRVSGSSGPRAQLRLDDIAVSSAPFTADQWRAYYWPGETALNIIGDYADPDNDGIPNLLERAMGTDPTRPTRPGPMIHLLIIPGQAESDHLAISFPRLSDPAMAGLRYTVEMSSTLEADDWVSDPALFLEEIVETNHPGIDRVILRLAEPFSPEDKRFLRLLVSPY